MRKPDELRTPVLDIVPMRRKHLKAIMPIEEVVYPRPWTLGVFHAEIDLVRREQRFYIIGEIGEELNLEDTVSVLTHYIDSIETDVDKEQIKTYMRTLYTEAVNIEVV